MYHRHYMIRKKIEKKTEKLHVVYILSQLRIQCGTSESRILNFMTYIWGRDVKKAAHHWITPKLRHITELIWSVHRLHDSWWVVRRTAIIRHIKLTFDKLPFGKNWRIRKFLNFWKYKSEQSTCLIIIPQTKTIPSLICERTIRKIKKGKQHKKVSCL